MSEPDSGLGAVPARVRAGSGRRGGNARESETKLHSPCPPVSSSQFLATLPCGLARLRVASPGLTRPPAVIQVFILKFPPLAWPRAQGYC